MSRSTLITTILIIVVVIIGAILITSGDKKQTNNPNQATTTQSTSTDNQSDKRRITAKHQYNSQEGLHIVAGEIDLPTPCHIIDHSVEKTGEGANAKIMINFTASVKDQDQMCAQVITARRFKVTFEADEGVDIGATYNGEETILNLVPVAEGENLEEFEVFQKG